MPAVRRLTTTWPDESEPLCHRCGHWEVSHGQDGGQCFWRCDNGDARMNAERLCRCRGYMEVGRPGLPGPDLPGERKRRQSSTPNHTPVKAYSSVEESS